MKPENALWLKSWPRSGVPTAVLLAEAQKRAETDREFARAFQEEWEEFERLAREQRPELVGA